jgi:hypothetical protein
MCDLCVSGITDPANAAPASPAIGDVYPFAEDETNATQSVVKKPVVGSNERPDRACGCSVGA